MDMVLRLAAFVQSRRQNLAAKEGVGGWRALLWAQGAPSSGEGVVNPLLAVAEATSGSNVQDEKAADPPQQV